MSEQTKSILRIENCEKHFPITGGLLSKTVGHVKAVDGVDLEVSKGETYSIVGESGCGKSTLARCILKLIEPTNGKIIFKGKDLTEIEESEMMQIRKNIQIVFQDPYWSLNPRMMVKDIVGEPIKEHKDYSKQKRIERVKELLELVGLSKNHLRRYPHEFSGGQKQRIALARALALNPEFLVLDEPTSALDVSVQAQILNLLNDLQEQLDITYLFISHDLSVIKFLSDKVGVMYLGKIVESGEKDKIFENPLHPYTRALLSSIPEPDPSKRKNLEPLRGEVPDPSNPPEGCNFHPRCPLAQEKCSKEEPELRKLEERKVACHYAEKNIE